MELTKASEGARGFKERFRRSRPNSVCDPLDMIPASEGQRSVGRAEAASIDQEEEMEEEIEEEIENESQQIVEDEGRFGSRHPSSVSRTTSLQQT